MLINITQPESFSLDLSFNMIDSEVFPQLNCSQINSPRRDQCSLLIQSYQLIAGNEKVCKINSDIIS